MAWHTVTASCGHQLERVQLYGKHTERERTIARMESYPCPDCRADQAQQQANREGLATLTGTPKQVSWAADVRTTILAEIDHVLELAEATDKDAAMAVRLIRDELRGRADARWWIDHRNESARTIIREARGTVASAVGR